jgi:hypothetical protein
MCPQNIICIKRIKINILNMNWIKDQKYFFFNMFIQVLGAIHWWLCKHQNGTPFPATLEQERLTKN